MTKRDLAHRTVDDFQPDSESRTRQEVPTSARIYEEREEH